MYTLKIHKRVKYRFFVHNFSNSVYCKNSKKKKINCILYLDDVLFIWRKLERCISICLSYCKVKLKYSE